MAIALLILGAFIMYTLQSALYKRRWNRGLTTTVSFQEHPAVEGEEGFLVETIVNRKSLPLPTLQVKFHINGALEFQAMENTVITDNTYRNDIFSILSYEKLVRKHPFYCRKRGYYHIDGVDILSYDLFHLHKSVETLSINTILYVYPKQVNISLANIPFHRLLGTILTKRYHMEDPFEFRNIRQYQIYDTMKDINWKASAKTGELKVNVHNYTASQSVTIFLNLYSDTNWRFDAISEESIRLAATYANLLLSQGIMTELVTNGIDVMTGAPLFIRSGAGKEHIVTINEGLARLDISQDAESFMPYIEAALNDTESASKLYVMISRVHSEDLVNAFTRLNYMSPGSQWICPLHPDMPYTLGHNALFDCEKWEVPYGQE